MLTGTRPAGVREPPGLADAMRDRTRSLHARAERSGVIRALLKGTATRTAYAMLLRNLLPTYRALEHGLERRRESLKDLAHPAVFRAAAIERDLGALCGAAWRGLPLLPAGARYASRVDVVGRQSDAHLVAHAYVRFLGDLNGGQLMRTALARSLELPSGALTFYDFPQIADLQEFRREYRAAFDRPALHEHDREEALEEAELAFALNIDLSESIARTAHAEG